MTRKAPISVKVAPRWKWPTAVLNLMLNRKPTLPARLSVRVPRVLSLFPLQWSGHVTFSKGFSGPDDHPLQHRHQVRRGAADHKCNFSTMKRINLTLSFCMTQLPQNYVRQGTKDFRSAVTADRQQDYCQRGETGAASGAARERTPRGI